MMYVLAGSIVFVILWNTVFFPMHRYRYRIMVEIDTPSEVKSGAAVHEINSRDYPKSVYEFARASGIPQLSGEAVVVDLDPGADGKPRVIVALLPSATLVYHVFKDKPQIHAVSDWPMISPSARDIREVPGALDYDKRLTVVTFTDITNPASAKVVFGQSVRYEQRGGGQEPVKTPIDTFAATFGPGYAFKRAMVEIVPAGIWPFSSYDRAWPQVLFGTPVTRGIEAKLPWWNGPNRPAEIAARAAGLPLNAFDVESYFIRGF